jgi:hypothetical protein
MKDEVVEQLIREFLEANPQYAKNKSFYIDSEGAVQVIPNVDGITKRSNIPSDVLALADSDEKGSIRVYPTPDVFEMMYFRLLDYYFGKTSFLEMLARWEEVMGIKPHQAEFLNRSEKGNKPS